MYIVRFILIFCLYLTSCTTTRPPKTSYFEVVGDQARRVEIVTAMLAKFHALPTSLHDAKFVEEKMGDDAFGPADYRAFTLLEVEAENIAAWQAILTPLATTPTYNAPSQPYTWWIDQETFSTLNFYAPETLSGRLNGWIAIDPENARIYIYTFTT